MDELIGNKRAAERLSCLKAVAVPVLTQNTSDTRLQRRIRDSCQKVGHLFRFRDRLIAILQLVRSSLVDSNVLGKCKLLP
jgi:hypothetical protein